MLGKINLLSNLKLEEISVQSFSNDRRYVNVDYTQSEDLSKFSVLLANYRNSQKGGDKIVVIGIVSDDDVSEFKSNEASTFKVNDRPATKLLNASFMVGDKISSRTSDLPVSKLTKKGPQVVSDQAPGLLQNESTPSQARSKTDYGCCCCFCCMDFEEEEIEDNPVSKASLPVNRILLSSVLNAPTILAGDHGVSFTEVIPAVSGIEDGRSWGGAWGDVNGDGYPDLWLNGHQLRPHLYLNQADGTFRDGTRDVFGNLPFEDNHGTAWADFDNDGDQDLAQMRGASFGVGFKPKVIYVNNDSRLVDQASSLGLDYPSLRGRGVLWFDFNNDGLLDFAAGGYPREDSLIAKPKIFFQKGDGTFEDGTATTGFEPDSAVEFLLSDVNGDGRQDLFISDYGNNVTVYDTSIFPFVDITASVFDGVSYTSPSIIADFNNDLLLDIYETRGGRGWGGSSDELYQIDPFTAVARVRLRGSTTTQAGLQFIATGDVTFEINSDEEIYLGANAREFIPSDLSFSLSPQDSRVTGIRNPVRGVDPPGIYIGYDPVLGWKMILWSPDSSGSFYAGVRSTTPITNLEAVGFSFPPVPREDTLLINTDSGFVDVSDASGINRVPIYGKSAVAGDFDNDMDLDIYFNTSRSVINTPNILLENQGNGTFVAVPDAWGAEGTNIGIGDFVIIADYDLNGFLDLLVANGQAEFIPRALHSDSLFPIFQGQPNQLFRNNGNDNHWSQFDLEGRVSNRDGIGAQAILTAGGIKQLREQSGGITNQAQNFQRLHFGLADNTLVQELVINWPSGRVQRITNLPVDRLMRVIEAGDASNELIVGSSSNDIASGEGGRDTLQGLNGDDYLDGGAGNDSLNGGAGNDTLIGGTGRDTLTGGGGSDVIRVGFGQSIVAAPDRMTDFNAAVDRIDLLTSAGDDAGLITAVTRAANSSTASLSAAVTAVFADANRSLAGNQPLRARAAAQLQWIAPGSSAREFLVVNNYSAGFQANLDTVIEVTGVTGGLSVASFI